MSYKGSGQTFAYWMEHPVEFPAHKLAKNLSTDVCIVGAGIAGLLTAYFLLQQGKKVVILEAREIAGGETSRTTAHLSNVLDDRFTHLEKLFGKENARLAAASHTVAIDEFERIIHKENAACDFERVDSYLFGDFKELEEEKIAASEAGLKVEFINKAPLPDYNTGTCLHFSRQAQFHPLKFLAALKELVLAAGGEIYTHTPVVEYTDDEFVSATTDQQHTVTAKHLVFATNTPINNRVILHSKIAPYRTYAIAGLCAKTYVPKALYYDTLEPYHYVRVQPFDEIHDLLIVGGEDHKTGQEKNPEERFTALESWARERFPRVQEYAYRWSGQVFEPVDSLAYIGRNPLDRQTYIITGDSGHGMTHAMIGALLIRDLISGIKNPWEQLYDPSRKTVMAAGEYLKENANVAVQYVDWLSSGEAEAVQDIPRGEGAVMREGLQKLAVYKDGQGNVHTYSAVCPHLGCIVEWNSVEKSWDCPCHGSRFSCKGKVLCGPAITPLASIGNNT